MRRHAVAAGTLLMLAASEDAEAQCGTSTQCAVSGGPECVASPSSLMPVTPGGDNPIWQIPNDEGNCGFESCWIFFYCPCGDPLAGAFCSG
jgi:hypothetical protein